jgi:hypothetical protein
MATRRTVLRQLGAVVGAGAVSSTVGVPTEDSISTRFTAQRHPTQQFDFQQKLFPEEGDATDMFGSDIAVSGGTAVIGAPGDEDPNGGESGSVYVFERRGGEWSEQQKLVPEDGTEDDRFGSAVALSDNTLVGGTENAGAYVFGRGSGGWSEQQHLTTDDAEDDQFGSVVATTEETIVIGAPSDQNRNGDDVGSAYVFAQRNGEWSRQQQLVPDDGDNGDQFGSAVAIDTSLIIVTARSDWDPNGDDAGSAYVFERRDGGWTQQQKLAADAGDENDQFGSAVSLSEGTTVIGAPSDDNPNGNEGGSAYVFSRTDDGWTQQQKLAADNGDERDQFGSVVSLDKNLIAIGAITDENPNGSDSGSVYIFEREGSTWRQRQKLAPSGADARDRAGFPALSSGELLIGAPFDEDPNGNNAGSMYAFAREAENEPPATPTPDSTATTSTTTTPTHTPGPDMTETPPLSPTTTPTSEPTTAESPTTSPASTTTAPAESPTTTAPTTEPPRATTTTGQSGFGLVAVGAAVVLVLKRFRNQQ